jgi:site-specific DNA-methyltransferase (adenine-specific)
MAIELLHIDCMEYMRGLPDKAFDLAIVDPPYGIDINSSGRLGHYGGKGKKWDAGIPGPEYFAELGRVAVNAIVWGGNYFHLPPTRCFLIWDKMQPEGVSFASCELAWTTFDQSAKTFYMRPQGDARIHPTQKPVALYRWLLKNYAKPGQRILDTHLGSGSIAIACDMEGFNLVGCEIDADYIAGARKRLADHQAQPRLFDQRPFMPVQSSIDL